MYDHFGQNICMILRSLWFLCVYPIWICFAGGWRISSQLPAQVPTPLECRVEVPQPASAGRTGASGAEPSLFSLLVFCWGRVNIAKKVSFCYWAPFSLSFGQGNRLFLKMFCLVCRWFTVWGFSSALSRICESDQETQGTQHHVILYVLEALGFLPSSFHPSVSLCPFVAICPGLWGCTKNLWGMGLSIQEELEVNTHVLLLTVWSV